MRSVAGAPESLNAAGLGDETMTAMVSTVLRLLTVAAAASAVLLAAAAVGGCARVINGPRGR